MPNHRFRLEIAIAKRDIDELTRYRHSGELSAVERRRAELELDFATLDVRTAPAIASRTGSGAGDDPWRPIELLLGAEALRFVGQTVDARAAIVCAIESTPIAAHRSVGLNFLGLFDFDGGRFDLARESYAAAHRGSDRAYSRAIAAIGEARCLTRSGGHDLVEAAILRAREQIAIHSGSRTKASTFEQSELDTHLNIVTAEYSATQSDAALARDALQSAQHTIERDELHPRHEIRLRETEVRVHRLLGDEVAARREAERFELRLEELRWPTDRALLAMSTVDRAFGSRLVEHKHALSVVDPLVRLQICAELEGLDRPWTERVGAEALEAIAHEVGDAKNAQPTRSWAPVGATPSSTEEALRSEDDVTSDAVATA